MKFGVITFPGSNCDHDLIKALREGLGAHVVHLWHKDTSLQGADMVFLPGGFSYGDYLRSGAIARFSPIMAEVARHAARGGYVMGICNGFQILTEAGLLPGALRRNVGTRFICDSVHILPVSETALPTRHLERRPYLIPIAHADGNYFAGKEELARLEGNGQVLFRYCDAEGNVSADACVNGSVNSIAGVANEGGNVFGMMPHPERAASALVGNTDGAALLGALLQALGSPVAEGRAA